MEIIYSKQWEYQLSKDDQGQLLLSVLCGSVGLFEIDIILNEQETVAYRKSGENYVQELAKEIRLSPKDWSPRNVNKG